MISIALTTLFFASALSSALTVRLGHHLGAAQPEKAKFCVLLSGMIGFCLISLNAMIMFGFRVPIARHFTKDDQVIEAVTSLLSIVSPCHFVVVSRIIQKMVSFGKKILIFRTPLRGTGFYFQGFSTHSASST